MSEAAEDPAAVGFLSASLAVRPARLAILVPEVKGISWLAVFEAALAAQAQYWGGQGNILLPFNADAADDHFLWSLLDLHDPDGVLLSTLSVADVEVAHPSWYREWERQNREHLARDFDHLGSEAVEETIERFREEDALEVADPPDAFRRSVVGRLGVLDGDGPFMRVSGSSGPGWPWMDASKLDELPDSITNPHIGRACGMSRRLWATAQHGRIASALRRELIENRVPIHDEAVRTSREWGRWLRRHREVSDLPWTLGEKGLASYGRMEVDLPPAIVVGDAPRDFALFYALRRWTTAAWWYPSSLARDPNYRYYVGSDAGRSHRVSREIAVVSVSASSRVLNRAADELRNVLPSGVTLRRMDWTEVLPSQPNTYYEWGGEGRPSPIPLVNGVTPALPTPIPRLVRARNPLEMHWMTEVRVDDWMPLRGSEIGGRVFPELGSSRAARSSSRGAVFFCPDTMILGGNALESAVVRPRLAPLPVLEQIGHLLVTGGRRCQLSDKGVWARESVDLFGSLASTCQALRDETIRPLLDEFVRRHRGTDRPYLTFKNAKEIVGDAGPAAMERLTDRTILHRGLYLKCVRCRREAWLALAEVDDSFTCPRCYLDQPVRAGSYLGNHEPAWVYRLAEVVLQLLHHNGDLPLLTVQDAFGDSTSPVDVAYEVEFFEAGADRPFQEVDMVVAVGHQLWLGEATKSRTLKDADRRLPLLAALADDLHARGVLFSTSCADFKASDRAAFEGAFPGSWPTLRMELGVACGPAVENS